MDIKNHNTNLERMRSLVLGNMPRTIVHTARQPVSESLEYQISRLAKLDPADSGVDEILIMAAQTFLDAEDDRAAAAAMTILIKGVRDSSDESLEPLLREIRAFVPKARAVYIREYKKETGDDRFDELLAYREFCERAHTMSLTRELLIVRYMESVDAFLEEELPPREAEDFSERIENRGHWLELTLKKTISQSRDYLKEPVTGAPEDVSQVKKILSMALDIQKAYIQFMKSPMTSNPNAKTWGDVVNEREV